MRYPLFVLYFILCESNRSFATGVIESDDATNNLLELPKRIRRRERLLFRLDACTKTGPSKMFVDGAPSTTTRETIHNGSQPASHETNGAGETSRDGGETSNSTQSQRKGSESHEETRIARRSNSTPPVAKMPSNPSESTLRNDSRETYEERRALLYRNMFAFDGIGSSLMSLSMPTGKGIGKARQRRKKTKHSSVKMKSANKLSRNG